jgi:hypothetical protein
VTADILHVSAYVWGHIQANSYQIEVTGARYLVCFYIIYIRVETSYLYSSPTFVQVIKSRRMRRTGHVARMEEGRGVYRFLVGKSEGRRPFGRPSRRWEDNIKADVQGCGGMGWIELAKDRDR